MTIHTAGFSHSSVSKESACNAGDLSLIPVSGRSPGEGNDNPLQYSCLENPMDRGAWRGTVVGYSPWSHKELDTIVQPTLSLSLVSRARVHFILCIILSNLKIHGVNFCKISCYHKKACRFHLFFYFHGINESLGTIVIC